MPHRDAPVDQVTGWCTLVGVVGEDASEGHVEGRDQVRVGGGPCVLELAPGHPETGGHVDLVQVRRAADHGGVALGPHLPEDPCHHVVDVGTRRRRARQGSVERRLRAAQVQDAEGHEDPRLPAGPVLDLSTAYAAGATTGPRPHRRRDGCPRIGHHHGMTSAAEISSLSSTLAELHERVTALAEGALANGDEDMAHELIAVERSLGGALRRLRRFGQSKGSASGARP